MTFRFLEAATLELEDAIDFYESRSPNLGSEFLTEIENAISRVLEFPDAWSVLSGEIRRCHTRRFPYFLVYTLDEFGDVLIISVFHQHRHPKAWKSNLE